MKELKIVLSLIILNIFNSNCAFQTKIFTELNQEFIGKNLIISPFSIFQLLSLTTNGAQRKTQEAMLDTLEIDNIEELNEINYKLLEIFNNFKTVEVANAIMSRFTPVENFTEIGKKYLATIEPLQSLEQINGWCNRTTHGRIPTILDKLDNALRMLLLNAIYFKGKWTYAFDHFNTRNRTFYNLNQDEKEIEMMQQTEHFNYYEDEKIQMVELPYRNDFMGAIIILPNKLIDINDYIASFRNNEDFDTQINEIISKKMKTVKVDLDLPKFEVKFSQNLNTVLEKLGMGIAFSSNANFSGMSKEEQLFIEFIIHKTFLKVDEDGTEAAAITAIGMFGGAMMPKEEEIFRMEVNRPFLFILRNYKLPEHHNMLFISKIEKL